MQGQKVPHRIDSDLIVEGEGTSEVKGSLRVYGKLIVRDEVQGQVPVADRWTEAITLSLLGDVEGQALIDGSNNVAINTVLNVSGVTPGIYGANSTLTIEVGADGRIKAVTSTPITSAAISPTEKGATDGVAPLVGGKVPTQYLPDTLFGGMSYAGVWNAATNTPALAAGIGTKGAYYKVSVAGNTVIDGLGSWGVGDFAAFNGTTWDKIDGGASEVTSVAGRLGAVVLTRADVGLGNVDNTSDAAKPISTATQTALDGKLSLSGGTLTGTIFSSAANLIQGTIGGITRGYLFTDATGFGFLNNVGSWAVRMPFGTSDLYVTGNVTAYSDERLKSDWKPLGPNFAAKLAMVKYGSYLRSDLGVRQLGVSAQSLQRVLPEAVSADDKGMLSVAYGNAAMVAAINLAVELGAVKSELQAVRNANSRLEAELNITRSTLAKAMAKHEEDCTYVLDQLELLKRKIK